ncbi:MAG: hypothetical protein NTX50_01910 [Candidatus Sumerlaeota bacterium]|nr:hypothetical protein [Candidatus Sumerlaeota bacterium]
MDRFQIRFKLSAINYWAGRYYDRHESEIINTVVPRVRAAGYLIKDDLLKIGYWKSPRIMKRIKNNCENDIIDITRAALSTDVERLRIGALILLDGVAWAVASAILHLCHRDPYPLLDFRALWSLGVESPTTYSFPFWWDYTQYCRNLAQEERISMRTLDRALWQYSKEKQKSTD